MESIRYVEDKYFLSVCETARLFGVSTHTVYRLIDKGELRAVKISKHRTAVSAEEINKYIEKKSGGTL